MGAVFFREGERMKDANTYFALNDTGANGDEKKEDGVFSTNGVSARTYSGKPAPPGPVILRMNAQRKDFGDLTVVDLEGLEIRNP